MPERVERVFLGTAVTLVIGGALWAAATSNPTPLSPADEILDQQGDDFDASDLRRVTVDDLLISFADNEVAGNNEWSRASISLVGYSVGTEDGRMPTVEVKAQGNRSLKAELQTRDAAASIRFGETVELLCLGATAQYGVVTAHDCELSYHGKRREKDPYWATPDALQDPL